MQWDPAHASDRLGTVHTEGISVLLSHYFQLPGAF